MEETRHMRSRKGSRWRQRQKWKVTELQILSMRDGTVSCRRTKAKWRDAERNERQLGKTEGTPRPLRGGSFTKDYIHFIFIKMAIYSWRAIASQLYMCPAKPDLT